MAYMEEHSYVVENTNNYVEEREPQVVERKVVASADAYTIRLFQLGAIEGALGEMDINPLLKPVLEAMHHVLAGGEIEIKLVEAGDPLVVQELNSRLEQVTEEANAINRQAGYSVLPRT
jgi:hypothetical protein